ncbi:MAG: prepilin peptidase [Candidatus Hydrogenedentes bacterium]|nr:prepilin peptidase [Candidatus Hydrogenedentota bacterium]
MDIQILNTVCSIFAFVLGAMVGSFLNVCVYRLPRQLSVVKPRSKCPKCDSGIAWYDNIPVVSWLVLGAKCRNCGQPISWQYPLVEAITGSLFFFVFWRYGFVLATPIYMVLSTGLVLVTFVDLTDWTIPNEVTFPGIPLGVACSVLAMYYPESRLVVAGPFQEQAWNSLLGVLVGGGSLYLLDKISLLLLGKRGMGFGDVKLLAMLGAFFGLYHVFVIILLASLMGSVIGVLAIMVQKAKPAHGSEPKSATEEAADTTPALTGHYLPFGPYLAIAGIIVMFFGADIIHLYTSFTSPPESPF